MASDKQRDTLYSGVLESIVDFSFDEAVAGVFPDMIQRSVPGYSALINLCGILAGNYAQPDSYCYDLGCSVGATTLSMRRRINRPGCRIMAFDNSPAMLDKCRINLAADDAPVPVALFCEDIVEAGIDNASVVVLNYTLQFVQLDQREGLIDRIFSGMRPGGALLLSEKVCFEHADTQQDMTALHHAFKRANDYSELEISRKRTALENVLVPESAETHIRRLEKAGFRKVQVWFRMLNFMSFLAVK